MVGKRFLSKFGKGKSPATSEDTPGPPAGNASLPIRVASNERTEKYGLFHLNPGVASAEEAGYLLDIVAVHGITGDAYRTWTAENGKLWLRDFLPDEFPGARIYSYGYPAEVFYSKSTADLDDYARKLLVDLKSQRSDSVDQSRRTIFLCHSMGGIVVKRALVIACLSRINYGQIRDSTSAILFFGTPHRGASLASIGSIMTKIHRTANLPLSGFLGNTRIDLVDDLKENSKLLSDVSRDFVDQTENIKIASFIEKANMAPLNTVIVDDSSARMNIYGETVIPMHDKNHRQVCQFSGKTSSDYQVVAKLLNEWSVEAKIESEELSPKDIACLQSLSFPEMESRRGEVTRLRHPDTCQWLLKHENYQTWIGQDSGLLWVKGKPGSGKSTIMSFLYQKIHDKATNEVLILDFYFHRRGTSLQKTYLGLLRTLLHQAIRGSKSIRPDTGSVFDKKEMFGNPGTDWNWEIYELEGMLRNAVLKISKIRKVLIFVDALDEAGEGAKDVLEFLHKMNKEVDSASSMAKICVACRHHPIPSSETDLKIVVEDNNREDISHYVHDTLLSKSSVTDQDLALDEWREIEREIVNKASGLFQWARLVTGIVIDQQHEGLLSLKEIRNSIKKVPEGLHEVYRHILYDVIKPVNRQRTLLLFQWVCFARRPLSMTELRYAMACDKIGPSQEACEDSDGFVETDGRMAKVVASLSGGLIEQVTTKYSFGSRKDAMQFIHESINDYIRSGNLIAFARGLENVKDGPLSASNPLNFVGQSHERLCRSCINHLTLEDVLDSDFKRHEIFHDRMSVENHPFLEYAASEWFGHATEAENCGVQMIGLAETFDTSAAFQKWAVISNKLDIRFGLIKIDISTTLLHIASGANLKSVVRLLLQNGNKVDAMDGAGHTALHWSARAGRETVSEMLIENGANLNALDGEGQPPLALASRQEMLAVVRLLLRRGARVDGGAQRSYSPLQGASLAGNVSLVRCLLESGADVNARRGEYCTALQAAAAKQHKTTRLIVQLLLDNKADVNIEGGEFGSALVAAASLDNADVFKVLLSNGADFHASGPKGNAMHVAAGSGNLAVVKFCLQEGSFDINDNGGQYGSALAAASRSGRKEIVELLLDKGADINALGGGFGSVLTVASIFGKKEMVELLLDKGADINAQGGNYGSALAAASRSGKKEIVELLLDKGADINAQGGNNGSALAVASRSGEKEIVELLLDRGADINAQGGETGSALAAASGSGEKKIVELLLEKGADINAQGGRYRSALAAALGSGEKEIVELLLDKGADINAQGGHYGSALAAASSFGEKEIVELLLDKGADINAQGGNDGSALAVASSFGRKKIVELLLDKGADINALGGHYGSALAAASSFGEKEMVELLLNKGADINALGGHYGSALAAASSFGEKEIVELLLNKGADINAQGGETGSALAAASGSGEKEIVKLLLDRGADIHAPVGPKGGVLATAKEGWSRRHRKGVIELLIKRGAIWDPDWEDYQSWLEKQDVSD